MFECWGSHFCGRCFRKSGVYSMKARNEMWGHDCSCTDMPGVFSIATLSWIKYETGELCYLLASAMRSTL